MRRRQHHKGMGKWQLDDTATPVFGLTRGQLLPVVERVAGEPVARFEVSIGHELVSEHYGGRGEKVIPTFEYRTQRGRTGRSTGAIEPGGRLDADLAGGLHHVPAQLVLGLGLHVGDHLRVRERGRDETVIEG